MHTKVFQKRFVCGFGVEYTYTCLAAVCSYVVLRIRNLMTCLIKMLTNMLFDINL